VIRLSQKFQDARDALVIERDSRASDVENLTSKLDAAITDRDRLNQEVFELREDREKLKSKWWFWAGIGIIVGGVAATAVYLGAS
jgi:uncharacterized coiled-coil DUF342 family protein